MSNDPHAGARVGALAILSGTCPSPGDDLTPFDPLARYMAEAHPADVPGPGYAGADVHYDAVYGHLVASAQGICSRYLTTVDADELAHCAGLIASIMTLQESADRHARRLADAPHRGGWREKGSMRAALQATTALARICDVVLAETGDARALARNATWAEGLLGEFPALTAFANGARGLLATGWPGSTFVWYPEVGCLGVHAAARKDGQIILDRFTALQDVAEDRAGIVRRATPTGRKGAHPGPGPSAAEQMEAAAVIDDLLPGAAVEPPGVVVFPEAILQGAGKSENRTEIKKLLGPSLGARLPLVPVPDDWEAWERTLVAEAPWHAPAIRAIRATQGGRSHWGNGVVLLVGGPGAGKSRLARRVGETSGLPFARYNCDASSDNSGLGGTSIRWVTAHPGILEPLLASAGKANGIVLLDEVEKCGGSRQSNGGKPHDLMHGLFEKETARAWKSPYLLAELDVSNILYVCTANSLMGIPSSLLDRMRVVHVQEPGPEHLGVLLPQVAAEACAELGLDPRWAVFDHVETEVLAGAWPGGSIRRLQRLVAGLLRARDGAPGPRH